MRERRPLRSDSACQVGRRDPEDALDAVRVPDTDLDVRLRPESRPGIDRRPFHEDAADGVERRLAAFLAQRVEVIDDGAVQVAQQQVLAVPVPRQLRAGPFQHADEAAVDRPQRGIPGR